MTPAIRVLIVDDSALCRQWLTAVVSDDPELTVAGLATNGAEAVALVRTLDPDLILMDINMPVMDGLEATKQIMAYRPTPILVVTSRAAKEGMALTFKALSFGALDVVDKGPLESPPGAQDVTTDLVARMKLLAGIKVITHPLAKLEHTMQRAAQTHAAGPPEDHVIAIAASTGGPQALAEIVRGLPADFPCGLVIIQHIAPGFAEGFASWLDGEASIDVRVPPDGARIEAGVAYVAPTQRHVRVGPGGVLRLTDDPPCNGHKPSADVLFTSIAETYGRHAIAVILSGMGSDGVAGLKAIKAAHGKVLAQDEATSVIFGMPGAAVDAGVVDEVLPVDRIADALLREAASPYGRRAGLGARGAAR